MFTIECSTSVAQEGRSQLASGLRFFRHPESSFLTIGRSSAQPTPPLTHSPKRSTRSTSLNTPLGFFKDDSSVSRPVQAHQLTRRLSQFQLGSFVDQAASETSSPSQSTSLEKILHPVPESDTSDPSKYAPLNTSKVPDVVESISQLSPFQPFGIVESMLGSKPPPASIVQSPPVSAMQTLRVIKYLRPGYLWDFWLADHSQYGKVVLKLVYLPNYPCNRPDYDDYVPPEEVITEALKEESLYLGPLTKLQGELVPKYYGLYHSIPGSYHIAILLEHAGHAIGPGEVDLDEEWQEKLYSAYQRLHRHGVVHRDVSTRHILIDDQERIRLVSFRRSDQKDLKDEDDVGTLMDEAIIVRTRIGPESLDEIDCDSLPAAYYSDLENPESFLQELRDVANAPWPDWVIEHNRRLVDLRLPPSDDINWEEYM
ncbi:hypothetical protein L486_03546 [Kwoniella mangroviensis CBS 10435]|uniref:Protein kinase domain-containing protein n=1 Tax=Kwoniella mangroviensis CBS 10435 TaxID=1331196 RepID=A0A1B9IU23_9TREE|nr:hypothetical protein L486_03546 [Kwoniella mangroviensis CBS 10435]